MYKLKENISFDTSMQVEGLGNGITIITINAAVKEKPQKLELILEWETDDIGVNTTYLPMFFKKKTVLPNWASGHESNIALSAPVISNFDYSDINKLTFACSDGKNKVTLKSGVVEESAKLINKVKINVDCEIAEYSTQIRIDTREIPFYKCVEDISKWWETMEGYAPCDIPEIAKYPMYSTWYSFHQQIDTQKIVEECEFFAKLGCRAVIVDDGWQTDNNERGYAYCGDWEPAPAKAANMHRFVSDVHKTGMKFLLWFSVPFVGKYSNAYKQFEGKFLKSFTNDTVFIIDPRYPDVREYLIELYKKAVTDWDIDGLKLDFIDQFNQCDVVKNGMDYISVYDAVDRLMKDIMAELRKIKPDILIEFRQKYIGPLMRTFGNIFRVADCPNDSYSNRLGSLSLRMTSGSTAVHSDMIMWNYSEPAHLAAFQLTNSLFCVPQISVLHDKMPDEHIKTLKTYLTFWTKYKNVLLDGEMFYKNYSANYTYVSSAKDGTQIGAVYAGKIAPLKKKTDEIIIINASLEENIVIESDFSGKYNYRVTDCMGECVNDGICELGTDLIKIDVPVNGYLYLTV